jgi:hypothetical protein
LQGHGHLQVVKRRGHDKSIGGQHPASSASTNKAIIAKVFL